MRRLRFGKLAAFVAWCALVAGRPLNMPLYSPAKRVAMRVAG